jgi:hypothetical protein
LPTDIGHRIANEHLLNPRCFWLDYPIPSTSACEATFVPGNDRYLWMDRYWRGPTWLFSTWFILRGLLRLGYEAESAHLADRTLAMIRQSGFREYFNPNTGEGMGARNFGVSTIAVEWRGACRRSQRGPMCAGPRWRGDSWLKRRGLVERRGRLVEGCAAGVRHLQDILVNPHARTRVLASSGLHPPLGSVVRLMRSHQRDIHQSKIPTIGGGIVDLVPGTLTCSFCAAS